MHTNDNWVTRCEPLGHHYATGRVLTLCIECGTLAPTADPVEPLGTTTPAVR